MSGRIIIVYATTHYIIAYPKTPNIYQKHIHLYQMLVFTSINAKKRLILLLHNH